MSGRKYSVGPSGKRCFLAAIPKYYPEYQERMKQLFHEDIIKWEIESRKIARLPLKELIKKFPNVPGNWAQYCGRYGREEK